MMILKVKPLEGHKVHLKFKDGVEKTVDLSDRLNRGIFRPLRRKSFFNKVRVGEGGGLEWPNGADICPDLLYWGGNPPWALRSIELHDKAIKARRRAIFNPMRKNKNAGK